MAEDSVITMSLKKCCIEGIKKLESHHDCEDNLALCRKCGAMLQFTEGKWRWAWDT